MCHCNDGWAFHILLYAASGYSPFKERKPWLIQDERNPDRLVSVVSYFGGIYTVEILKNKSYTASGPVEEFSEHGTKYKTVSFTDRFLVLVLNTLLSRYWNIPGLDLLEQDHIHVDVQKDWECPCCGYKRGDVLPCSCSQIPSALAVVLTRLFPIKRIYINGQKYKVTRDYSELSVSSGTSYSYTFRAFDSFLGSYNEKQKIL